MLKAKCVACEAGLGLDRVKLSAEAMKFHAIDDEGNPENPCRYPEEVNDEVTAAAASARWAK